MKHTQRIPQLPKIVIEEPAKIITLVCYLLEYLGALTEEQLIEIVTVDEIVKPFKLNDALATIEQKELAAVSGGKFTLNATGRTWLHEFENSLAVTLRRRMLNEGKNVVRLAALKKAVAWDVSPTKNAATGAVAWRFYACFMNIDDNSPLMEVKIYAKTKEAALKTQERFLKNPAEVFGDTVKGYI